MPVKEDKSEFCIDCLYVFDKHKKYHAQSRCNACYQKYYISKNMEKIYGVLGRPKQKNPNCIKCNANFDTLNSKGKPILRGSKGMCKKCYAQSFKPSKICKECGNEMMTGSNTGLCAICKLNNSTKKTKRKKEKQIPIIEKEQFELIRRLLVRYKLGMNNIVDNFRVIDVYMEVNDNPILLDTLSESAQLVEMLRNLKAIFDHNLPLSKKPNMGVKLTKKEYAKMWYENNRERLKKKYLNVR